MAATTETTTARATGIVRRERPGGGIESAAWDWWMSIGLAAIVLAVVAAVIVPSVALEDPARMFLVKVAAFVLLSFLPGWLYLKFVRHRAPSLYDEYVLNLFRLHIDELRNLPMPPQHTSYFPEWKKHHDDLKQQTHSETKHNLYRKKFETIFGRAAVSTYGVIHDRERPTFWERTEALSPVLVATGVLALGWALILQPELVAALNPFPFLQAASPPDIPARVLMFGFLGAYSFVLQDLIRRYFRADLKAGAYVSAAVRIVVVTLLVLALHNVWPGDFGESQEAAFAFLVGFFPLSGLQALRGLATRGLRLATPSFRVEYPLHELEGLNIWYEARLLEEGIEDMQNLVSANLVDLLLSTRVPVTRMVDWIDQACLRLHLPPASGKKLAESAPAMVKQIGIRTATELERAYRRLREDDSFAAHFAKAVGLAEGGADAGRAAATALIEGLKVETNLFHVREFRRHEWLLRDARRIPSHPEPSNGHSEEEEMSSTKPATAEQLASIASTLASSVVGGRVEPSSPPAVPPSPVEPERDDGEAQASKPPDLTAR